MASPENQIQNAILDYLALKHKKDGMLFGRINTGGVYDPTRKTFRSMPKYSLNGFPDIFVVKDGFFIGLEVKTKSGRQSANQKEFEKNCKQAGGEYYVVRSIDDVMEIGL